MRATIKNTVMRKSNRECGQTLVEYLIVLAAFFGLYLATGPIVEMLANFIGYQSNVLRAVL